MYNDYKIQLLSILCIHSWRVGCGLNISNVNIFHSVDQKFMGDLYQTRGVNIHSLSWVIQLQPKCTVISILPKLNEINVFHEKLLKNTKLVTKVCNKTLLKLIILKKLKAFKDSYIVAHPFFKLYHKVKKKIKQLYHKFIMRRNSTIANHSFVSNNSDALFINYYALKSDYKLFHKIEKCITLYLNDNKCIKYVNQEVLRPRTKREAIVFNDPLFKQQWHLKNEAEDEYDVNVFGAWESGITGRGITVCVIDDGLEWRHPDLRDNYNPRGSYDLNADDLDPSPVKNGDKNEHGTRCAGEIAAVANSVCGVGVAYQANISGIRVLGERMTDSMEAAAFVKGLGVNDIYSCSWGPNDDGKTVDGPHNLAKKALLHGVTYGRNGYGAIYVVASGNGGRNEDNCNYDGYANSIYTVTIGAVDSKGSMPYYAEECATMLAVTPSSGSNGKAIVTTDWQSSSKTGCTSQHSGTSAAAPLAAAVIALALEMQPCLSWRDIQYLIALTSRKIDSHNSDWILNEAGLHHSHQHGFGLMDATGMVSAAAVWESVPFSTSFRSAMLKVDRAIPSRPFEKLVINHTIFEHILKGYALSLLEVVQVYVTLDHEFRGSLLITLTCPSGTKSVLASPRIKDNSTRGLQYWPLGTVRCWGEIPWGTYILNIRHTHKKNLTGILHSWQLVLHGSQLTQPQFKERLHLVRRALKGEVVRVNRSQLCHPPELNFEPLSLYSDQTIKILVIFGSFLFLMAIYNTLEYIMCYNKEKKRFYQYLKDLYHSHSLGRLSNSNTRSSSPTPRTSLNNGRNDSHGELLEEHECQSLLSDCDSVPMITISSCYGTVSPSLSCEADISSLNEDSDDDDGDTISSRNTSDTVVPKDTSGTDFTTTTTELTTDFASDPDEDKSFLKTEVC